MTKLTLSVEEAVIAKAKELAAANHTSVSAMFSQFIESLAGVHERPRGIGPVTRSLIGVAAKVPTDKDYKELLTEALMEKYGVDE